MICNKCGSRISDDSKFCYGCGSKISSGDSNKLKNKSTKKKCSRCGKKINTDSSFCYWCGNTIDNVYDETYDYSTKNNNIQTRDDLSVDNIYNQNTWEQDYYSSNRETNRKRSAINFILLCVIVIFIVFLVVENTNKDTTSNTNISQEQLTKTYTDNEEDICFNFPDTWKNDPYYAKQNDLIFCLEAQVEQNFATNMSMKKLKTDTDQYNFDSLKAITLEAYSDQLYEVQEFLGTTIGDVNAIKMISTAPYGQTALQYTYALENDVYIISFISLTSNFNEYEPVFDKIMDTYTITRSYIQNSEDYGLSEEYALIAAQNFIKAHPLFERKLTGYVEYEPQVDTFSTTGFYSVEVVAPDGLHSSIWVEKVSGNIFLSPDGSTLRDGEELYLYNQNNKVVLFDGKKINNYLGTNVASLYTDFGAANYHTDIEGLTNVPTLMINYTGIGFIYNTEFIIESIIGNPKMFTYNGETLNKNYNELVTFLGEPATELTSYSDMYGADVYSIEYPMYNYTVKFTFKNKDSNACLISFIQ